MEDRKHVFLSQVLHTMCVCSMEEQGSNSIRIADM